MRNVRLEHPVSEKRVSVQKKEIDVGKNVVQRNNSKNSHGAKNKKSGKAARIIPILCAVRICPRHCKTVVDNGNRDAGSSYGV